MKKHTLLGFSSLLSLAFLSGCSVFGIRSGYEQSSYTVVDSVKTNDGELVEIRRYSARVAAEVQNAPSDNDAFRLLFKYISGENSTAANVSMTAPVEVEPVEVDLGQRVAMTVPVEVSSEEDTSVTMRFFLPSSFTLETAPKPTDPRVSVVKLPAEDVAAIRYSGLGSKSSFDKAASRLTRALDGSQWKRSGTPTYLGYDPPFTIPFLRRNEAVVRVQLPAQLD